MLPDLKGMRSEDITVPLRERAAQCIVDEVIHSQRVLLDKQGLVDEKVLGSVLDTVQETSWKDVYRSSDGRPIRFMVLHMGTSDLLSLELRKTEEDFVDQCVQFVSRVPAYIQRAETPEFFQQIRFGMRSPENMSPIKVLTGLARVEVVEGYKRFPIKFREFLKYFGNPPRYPMDDWGSNQYEEQDSNYPMTVPIFNLHFSANLPEDPNSFFAEYNHRYEQFTKDFGNGKKKRSDVFTAAELALADESAALVDLVDGMLYQSFGLPRTAMLIAAPLFPYQAIARRYGCRYENWLGFGPNDEVTESFRNARQQQI